MTPAILDEPIRGVLQQRRKSRFTLWPNCAGSDCFPKADSEPLGMFMIEIAI
jgi:hypothetical protein